jgi:hypothetical protein
MEVAHEAEDRRCDSTSSSMALAAEVIHLIITNLSAQVEDDLHTLVACSLVSRGCLNSSRTILFREICLSSRLQPFSLRERSHKKEDTHETFQSIIFASFGLASFIKRLSLRFTVTYAKLG